MVLKLAVWSPVSDIIKPTLKVRGASPVAVRDDLISLSRHSEVSDPMGEDFARIVEMCLKADSTAFGVLAKKDDREDSMLQGAFREKVVHVLAKATEALS